MNTTPTASHPSTLSAGQIYLSWTAPQYGNYKPAGYVLTCSHLPNMTQSTRCHDGVIPLTETSAIIGNRDVYEPFFISIQVVRNFNGEEVIDDVLSPSSSMICAGKMMQISPKSMISSSVTMIQILI